MQRRLCVVFESVAQARRMVSDLESSGISRAHMHSLSPTGADLADLPRAAGVSRGDLTREIRESLWFLNLVLCFAAGAGFAAAIYLGRPGYALAAAVLLGAGVAMVFAFVMGLPFIRVVSPFAGAEVVLVVEVPRPRVHEIQQLLARCYPGGISGAAWRLGGFGV